MIEADMLARLKRYNQGLKVLCVDDEEILREFLVSVLKNHFDFVDSAKNGEEALEKYSLTKYDLVLTDIKMPVMDGIELVRRIKETNPDQSILIFSAYQESVELIDLINLSVNHFLIKPFSAANFVKSLHDMCENIYTKKELAKYQTKLEKLVEDKTVKIRKQKEQIQKKNDFLQEIIDSLQLPFLVGEIQHEKIIHANKEVQSVIIPAGSSRFEYFFDSLTLKELADSESAIVKEKAIETEAKGLRLYTAYYFPVLEENGKIRQVIQYLVDITDTTRNLISTQGSEAKLRFELNSERIVSDLAKTANMSANLKEAARKILFIISQSFGISTVALYKIDRMSKNLILLENSSIDASPVRISSKISFGHLSEKLLTDINHGSKIIHADLSKLDNIDRDFFSGMNVKSFLIMPLSPDIEVSGILVFLQPEEFFWNFKYFNLYSSITGIISSLWNRSE